MTTTSRVATRLAMALCVELSGRPFVTQRHCPSHKGHLVELCIFLRANGLIRVEAIVPIQDYRVLQRQDFAQVDVAQAVETWREAFIDLFDCDPLP